jgi:formylglycine-generating enzyme required for sulfatase activity
LANGNVIWDLSGNVWEWTNNTCTQGTGTGNWYNSAWIEWTDSNLSDYEKATAGPAGSYTGSNGVGRYLGCSTVGNAFIRGGAWDGDSYAGAFALGLVYSPSIADATVGFRCAR